MRPLELGDDAGDAGDGAEETMPEAARRANNVLYIVTIVWCRISDALTSVQGVEAGMVLGAEAQPNEETSLLICHPAHLSVALSNYTCTTSARVYATQEHRRCHRRPSVILTVRG